MAQRAIKRMANAGMIKGWTAWYDKYEEAARQKRMLAGAAARLSRPMLVACFTSWREDWDEMQRSGAPIPNPNPNPDPILNPNPDPDPDPGPDPDPDPVPDPDPDPEPDPEPDPDPEPEPEPEPEP